MSDDVLDKIIETVRNYGKAEKPGDFTFVSSRLCWDRIETDVRVLLNYLPLNSRVLELGCGYGHTTALLAASRRDLEVIGTDLKQMPVWDKLAGYGCSFKTCDATDIPAVFRDFDAVVSFGVIEHTSDDDKFLGELRKCLKENGYNIMFNMPSAYSLPEFLAKMCGIIPHERKYRKPEIKKMLEKNGFEIVSMGREHCLPAQVQVVSRKLGDVFNNMHRMILKIDRALCRSPLALLAQDFYVVSRKK